MILMAAKPQIKRTVNAPPAPKANRYQITVTMNSTLSDAIDKIAKSKGWNRSELYDRMAEFYLSHHKADAE